jgi:hypothetical protein
MVAYYKATNANKHLLFPSGFLFLFSDAYYILFYTILFVFVSFTFFLS